MTKPLQIILGVLLVAVLAALAWYFANLDLTKKLRFQITEGKLVANGRVVGTSLDSLVNALGQPDAYHAETPTWNSGSATAVEARVHSNTNTVTEIRPNPDCTVIAVNGVALSGRTEKTHEALTALLEKAGFKKRLCMDESIGDPLQIYDWWYEQEPLVVMTRIRFTPQGSAPSAEVTAKSNWWKEFQGSFGIGEFRITNRQEADKYQATFRPTPASAK